ncbi:MAG: hypothetical protein HYY43_06920, partial [Deltaproteobacteria bacterium]|nr:hypothetical protein [Deltaproteobacteria bacterium]
MIILAPAKINIILRVLGKRSNGYHDLLMLNEKLGISDEIIIDVGIPKYQHTKTQHFHHLR